MPTPLLPPLPDPEPIERALRFWRKLALCEVSFFVLGGLFLSAAIIAGDVLQTIVWGCLTIVWGREALDTDEVLQAVKRALQFHYHMQEKVNAWNKQHSN